MAQNCDQFDPLQWLSGTGSVLAIAVHRLPVHHPVVAFFSFFKVLLSDNVLDFRVRVTGYA